MVNPLDNLTSSEQLRRLLLQEEQERIDRLEARLGDDEALKNSLIPIIADVLRDAGVEDYRRLADALAPVVLQCIKTEIHNSRDMMVDALYPITGRLVAAAVRNAFKDLVDQLNSKLDSGLSIDRWRAKLKAKMSGRSEAEVLLSEGAAFEIIDLLLINRQSGLLIAKAGGDDEHGGMDSHLLSSILTAIMAFVRDAMSQSSEQDLRTLHVGDVRLHLQVSPSVILAVKTKGPPPARFDTALNETFYAFLERWGEVLIDPDQIESHDEMALSDDLTERIQSLLNAKKNKFRGPSNKGAILLGGLAAAVFVWIGWAIYEKWSGDRIEAMAQSVIDGRSELTGYPIVASYRHADEALVVSGLLPNQKAIINLRNELETTIPKVSLAMNVGRLPDQTIDFPTHADFTDWQKTMHDELAQTFDDRMVGLSETVANIHERLPKSTEVEQAEFRSWLNRQLLKFGDNSTFYDEIQADAVLRELVDRFSNLPSEIGLRVVGYADDLGEEKVSARVSRSRASLVAGRLSGLGISSERLRVVGRGKEKRLGDVDGLGSVNRRVEFEMIYLSDQPESDNAPGNASHGTR